MHRSAASLLTFVLLSLAWAGCLDDEPPTGPPDTAPTDAHGAAHAVIAVIDSGINAYHLGFRDDTPEAHQHPATYLDGYPADAVALHLTLDAPDWKTAVAADCETWNGLQAGRLYWVPGTRIVGISLDDDWAGLTVDCAAGETPLKGLDTWAPHGSGAAGRAAGADTSLCHECKIVVTQMGQNTQAMEWAAAQPWIDVQTNSWAGFACHMADRTRALCDRGPPEAAVRATRQQVTFAASGNGIRPGGFGVAGATVTPPSFGIGIPTYLRPAQGQPGVLIVGGHDNGEVLLWPGTMPHVIADSWAHPSTAWDAFEGGSFGGTSGATPFAAGTFAQMILEARRAVGDTGTGLRDGDLVIANGSALPASGPLADGVLTRAEAERLFVQTALARPAEDLPFDGTLGGCATGACVSSYANTMVPWSAIPEEVPAYYLLGYGQVGTVSLHHAIGVLRGEAEHPERPMEDRFFQVDATVREADD